MRCFFRLAANAVLGVLAGFGMADVAAAYGLAPEIYGCTGLIGGCLAGAAACL
jgi:hypothetical protein